MNNIEYTRMMIEKKRKRQADKRKRLALRKEKHDIKQALKAQRLGKDKILSYVEYLKAKAKEISDIVQVEQDKGK
jgi:hypothetical protein